MKKQSGKNKLVMRNLFLIKININRARIFPLNNFSLIRLLYMHRLCLHGPINSYHSFSWNNLILCLNNVNTLNICMKEFCSEKIIFDEMTAVRT